jgi:hypothetical protein
MIILYNESKPNNILALVGKADKDYIGREFSYVLLFFQYFATK